jgi:hypothetical protein
MRSLLVARRAWLFGLLATTAACGTTTAEMDAGDGASDSTVPRDGGHDATAADAPGTDATPGDAAPDAPPGDAAADAPREAGDAGTGARPDARADGSSGACSPPMKAPGEPCDGSTKCGTGLTCDISGSWVDGLGPDASVRCLEHAGTCCTKPGDCLSGLCEKGECALSPLDNSCGTAADCVPDGAPYGDSGTYCYDFIYGRCCPLHSLGAPPGCPGA